ncbi:Monocarboxylate transporter 10 [Tupaia chinensis]|uniref:Monocarboxylate transporter 10 n=1 Tax=Tupaia chinensis TaxID=246437 RepID=L9JIE0_TUPCH|nr:Monocarboxylate transporter 10 [Tupaia chinensis]
MLAAMWCNGSVFGIQNACGVLFVSMLKTFGSKDDDKMVFKTGEALHPLRDRGDRRGSPSASPVRVVGPRRSVGRQAAQGCVSWPGVLAQEFGKVDEIYPKVNGSSQESSERELRFGALHPTLC